MSFFAYFIMGSLAYGAGWAVRRYLVTSSEQGKPQSSINQHPATRHEASATNSTVTSIMRNKRLIYCALFFAMMLPISAVISRFILEHPTLDILYVLVNSVVATFIFGFALMPAGNTHGIPD